MCVTEWFTIGNILRIQNILRHIANTKYTGTHCQYKIYGDTLPIQNIWGHITNTEYMGTNSQYKIYGDTLPKQNIWGHTLPIKDIWGHIANIVCERMHQTVSSQECFKNSITQGTTSESEYCQCKRICRRSIIHCHACYVLWEQEYILPWVAVREVWHTTDTCS